MTSDKAKRLVSLAAIPGWLLMLWKPIYTALNAASNFEFVRQHIGQGAQDFLVANGYYVALGAGVLWLGVLVLRREKPKKPKRQLGKATERVLNRQFFNETVHLDGRSFDGCRFTDCRLEFHGVARCSFVKCVFRGKYLLISDDEAVDAFLDADRQLKLQDGPFLSIPGKQNQRTGEFSGPIKNYLEKEKEESKSKGSDAKAITTPEPS